MGRQKATWGPKDVERLRAKLNAGKAVEVLNRVADDKETITKIRLDAIAIILRKTLPDTSSVELTGGGGAPLVFTWKQDSD